MKTNVLFGPFAGNKLVASCLLAAGVASVTLAGRTAKAQVDPSKFGWLEGAVTAQDGSAVGDYPYNEGALLQIQLEGSNNRIGLRSQPSEGGFYTFKDLKPGIYEMWVSTSQYKLSGGEDNQQRPEHIFSISIEPQKRTVLNVRTQPGKEILEVGQPSVESQPVIIVSEAIKKLQGEIDALKKN